MALTSSTIHISFIKHVLLRVNGMASETNDKNVNNINLFEEEAPLTGQLALKGLCLCRKGCELSLSLTKLLQGFFERKGEIKLKS